jgi:ribosomal protein L37AE/L43A
VAVTTPTNKIYAGFAISKFDETEDGHLIVYGKATDASLDSDRQIIDKDWSGSALKEWMSTGANVRVQHQARRDPAGKGIGLEIDRDGDTGHWLKALVVEPVAKDLVRHGVLRAFSVGIADPVIERDMTGKAAGGIIKGGTLFEVSLVDRPANKNCGFTLAKAAGPDEEGEWGDVGDFDALLFEAKSAELAKGEAGASPDSEDDTTDDDSDDSDGDMDDDDKDDEDAKKAYRERRAAWKSAEPSLAKAAGPTEYLQARAAYQKWLAEGEAEGIADGAFNTPEGIAQFVAKRKFDRNVGGGVDRDKIPAEDFAGPNRSYPIVTPQDVADAAGLIGHADNPDAVKAKIISIAKRKGAAFVAKLPKAWNVKAAEFEDAVEKAKKPAFDGAAEPFDGKDKDGDGQDADKPVKKPKKATKAGGKTCPKCGKVYHADSKVKFCKKCGAKLPGGSMKEVDVNDLLEKVASGEITAAEAADMLEKAKRRLPADTKPAGAHREPDGELVEDLEPKAGLPTEPDKVPDKQPSSIQLSYSAKRMHDVFCSAYHEDAIRAEYPSLKGFGDAADEAYWGRELAKATADGDAVAAVELSGMVFAAQQLKAADPAAVADARAEMHKAFADLYPNTAKPTPTDMSPGKFQRPYLSAGRAPLQASGTPRVPPSTHTPEPSDFQRGLITSGHQAKPPAAKGDGNNPNGYDARGYYGPAARAAAANYMKSQHDRLVGSQPDLCPMAASASVMPPEQGAANVPHTPSMPQTYAAPGEKSQADNKALLKTIKKVVESNKKTYKAFAERDEATVKALNAEIEKLREQLDQLGSQPDPDQAPVRGVSRKSAAPEAEVAPVERRSLVDEAQQQLMNEREQEIAYATRLMKSGDPALRNRGEAWLEKLIVTPAAE